MTATIRELGREEFLALLGRSVDIYFDAMNYHPGTKPARSRTWADNSRNVGFRAVGVFISREQYAETLNSLPHKPGEAVDASVTHDSVLIGIAYGFMGCQTQWWDRMLRVGLAQSDVPTELAQAIVSNYFEVAEVHIDPLFQGNRFGEAMLRKLLGLCPGRFAVLSTPEVPQEDNRAFRLYRRLGFVDLLRYFYYPGDNRPFAILVRSMGLEAFHAPRV